jgi:DNA-binding LacI/PurR family transcriptional regulator
VPTYEIVLNGRPHFNDVTKREVESICHDLGYSPSYVLRKLREKGRATLSDDVGDFTVVRVRNGRHG